MLDVICVCKSGGVYDADWVARLKRGLERNLGNHRLRCLSDIEVPCERIPLHHDWPGWWSKIELFRPGVIENPTLYLDLDTVIVGSLEAMREVPAGFAMLRSFWDENMVGSGVMWFGDKVPTGVYNKFSRQADAYIQHYELNKNGPYVGDQAFIWDTMGRQVEQINDYFDGIVSYKMHCKKFLPKEAKLVCFHGTPRPTEVDTPWMREHWSLPMMTESDIA